MHLELFLPEVVFDDGVIVCIKPDKNENTSALYFKFIINNCNNTKNKVNLHLPMAARNSLMCILAERHCKVAYTAVVLPNFCFKNILYNILCRCQMRAVP